MARKNRPEPTLADYMAIAIGPALIIVLVSSVAFFLLKVFYGGQFAGVSQWTMGCFCVAAVLISRVSIVEGAERAALFGAVLAAAVGLAMMRYVDHVWITWFVLGVIWAFASQLVWNCTLVDDADDSSGEGLLEAAGLEGTADEQGESAAAGDGEPAAKEKKPPKQFPSKQQRAQAAAEAAAPPPPPPPPLWRRLWDWWQRGSSRAAPPGIWIIYCSLIALPIFGFGQWFMDRDSRDYGFALMFRYVAAAMLLLLTTSFLGLRRYLRQRKLEMPLKMAGVWLGVGGVMVAVILLLALLIPRPNPDYSLASLGRWITSPKRQASDHAVLKKSTADGESSKTAPADEAAKSAQPDGEKRPGESEPSSQSGAGKAGEPSKGPSGEPAADGKQPPQGGGPKGEQGAGGQGKQPGQSPDGKSPDGQSQGGKQASGESKSNQGQPGEQDSGKQPPGKQADTKTNPDQAPANQQPADKSPAEQSQQSAAQQPAAQQPATQQEKAQQEKQQREQEKQREPQATRPGKQPAPPKPSGGKGSWTPSLSWLSTPLKVLFYLVAAIAVIYLLIRYWDEVRDWLARLWQEVLDLWNSLFGGRKQEQVLAAAAAEEAKPRPRPFAAFKDPFLSGEAARGKPGAVVQYSFEALEAWAIERGVARQPEETPLEFAGRLSADATVLGTDAQELASLYARVAYARDPLSPASLTSVERLWKTLRRTAAPIPPSAITGAP